jgi:hypothetical protein
MVQEQRQSSIMAVTQMLSSLSFEAKIGIVVAAAAVFVISKFAFGSSNNKRGMCN